MGRERRRPPAARKRVRRAGRGEASRSGTAAPTLGWFRPARDRDGMARRGLDSGQSHRSRARVALLGLVGSPAHVADGGWMSAVWKSR
jgi:hypothetical protein